MKNKLRLFLCITALFPALFFCGAFALAFPIALFRLKFDDAIWTLSFFSCVVIYILFVLDTIKGFKNESTRN